MEDQTEQNYLLFITVEVTKAISSALETLIHEKGFKVPIYMAAIGANGYTYAVKYQRNPESGGLEAKEMTEHTPDEEGARFPINMLFVDCRGYGAHVVVKTPAAEGSNLH